MRLQEIIPFPNLMPKAVDHNVWAYDESSNLGGSVDFSIGIHRMTVRVCGRDEKRKPLIV
jgi:hypothetical protein